MHLEIRRRICVGQLAGARTPWPVLSYYLTSRRGSARYRRESRGAGLDRPARRTSQTHPSCVPCPAESAPGDGGDVYRGRHWAERLLRSVVWSPTLAGTAAAARENIPTQVASRSSVGRGETLLCLHAGVWMNKIMRSCGV